MTKIWNDNVHPHSEMFKGTRITIPAKDFVEMEWEEAIELRSQFTGLAPLRADGTPDPAYYKMLRVDPPATPIFRDETLVNHADGKRAATKAELQEMLGKFSHRLVDDPDAEKAASSQAALLQAENAALKDRLAAIEAKLNMGDSHRGPGRPRKDAMG
jgi:hypothetical protein